MGTDLRRLLFADDFDPENDTSVLNEILTEIYDAISGKQSAAPAKCKVTLSANQTFTTAVEAAIEFDTEEFNPDAMWSNASSTTKKRITFRESGTYLVIGRVRWAANATGRRQLSLRANGSTVMDQQNEAADAFAKTQLVAVVDTFNVNDYVELLGTQTSGGNLDIETVGAWSPRFEAIQLATSL